MNESMAVNLDAVMPLLIVGVGAVGAVLLESLLRPRPGPDDGSPRRSPARIGAALSLYSTAVLLAAIATAAGSFAEDSSVPFQAVQPPVVLDGLAAFATVLVSTVGLGALLLSSRYLQKLRIHRGETYALLLLSVAGMLLLVSAADLVTVFLGVEGMCLPLYALAGLDRHRRTSSESALKFQLLGTFASALGLFGIALLYGATGATGFAELHSAFPEVGAIGRVGAGLLCAGLGFRIAAVPFHAWAPDVEEGAPTPVAAFVSVAMRTTGVIVLLRVVLGAFDPTDLAMVDVFRVVAMLTLSVGAVMAVVQENLKRLLAYVGIANLGFVLLAFVPLSEGSVAALLFSLAAFGFSNLGAFGILVVMADRNRGGERLGDFTGLGQRRPALAAGFSLFLFSLAGIPGTAGFVAKLQVMLVAVRSEETALFLVAGFANLVLLYATLRVPVVMYMNPEERGASRPTVGSAEGLVLLACAAAVLIFGLLPNGVSFVDGSSLIEWTRAAAASR